MKLRDPARRWNAVSEQGGLQRPKLRCTQRLDLEALKQHRELPQISIGGLDSAQNLSNLRPPHDPDCPLSETSCEEPACSNPLFQDPGHENTRHHPAGTNTAAPRPPTTHHLPSA